MVRSGGYFSYCCSDSFDYFDFCLLWVGVVVGRVIPVPIMMVFVVTTGSALRLLGCNHHPARLRRGTQRKRGTQKYG